MQEQDIIVFRGLTIMMLTIIAYMLIDSLLNIPLITFILCGASGTITIFMCKDIDRKELKTFRAVTMLGAIFFIAGNYVVLKNADNAYFDTNAFYLLTLGYFLSAIGMIVMFSSIPLIIYKDIKDELKTSKTINRISY